MAEPGWWRTVWSLSVVFLVVSYYIKGNLLWGHKTRWTDPRFLHFKLLENPVVLSEAELAHFNGEDPNLPIYLAINGTVFDVSARPQTYGPLGAYRFFSGRDAARAFATGCFDTDLTHDLRELDEDQIEAIRGWHTFFTNHVRYWPVGTVEHAPLTGPAPPPCQKNHKPH